MRLPWPLPDLSFLRFRLLNSYLLEKGIANREIAIRSLDKAEMLLVLETNTSGQYLEPLEIALHAR